MSLAPRGLYRTNQDWPLDHGLARSGSTGFRGSRPRFGAGAHRWNRLREGSFWFEYVLVDASKRRAAEDIAHASADAAKAFPVTVVHPSGVYAVGWSNIGNADMVAQVFGRKLDSEAKEAFGATIRQTRDDKKMTLEVEGGDLFWGLASFTLIVLNWLAGNGRR